MAKKIANKSRKTCKYQKKCLSLQRQKLNSDYPVNILLSAAREQDFIDTTPLL